MPGEFGLYASWLGVVVFISVLITGRFETALAIVEEGESRRLAFISTLFTATVSSLVLLLLAALVVFMFPSFVQTLGTPMLLSGVFTAFTIAVMQVWQSWAAAEGLYKALSIIRVVNATAITLSQIVLGILNPHAEMLAFGYFLGGLVACGVSFRLFSVGRSPVSTVKLSEIKAFFYKYRKFPLFSLPADAINTAAAQLPVILVASRFGAEIAGLLAMTIRILGAPLGLLGKSVLDVFKRHAAARYREYGECRAIYIQTFKVLFVGAFLFLVTMFFLSETLFVVAFGEQWRYSGVIAKWMLPYFALAFLASPLSYMVYIAGKQHLDLFWQISLLVMTLLSLSMPDDYSTALKTYSIGYASLYVIYIIMSYRFSLGGQK